MCAMLVFYLIGVHTPAPVSPMTFFGDDAVATAINAMDDTVNSVLWNRAGVYPVLKPCHAD